MPNHSGQVAAEVQVNNTTVTLERSTDSEHVIQVRSLYKLGGSLDLSDATWPNLSPSQNQAARALLHKYSMVFKSE